MPLPLLAAGAAALKGITAGQALTGGMLAFGGLNLAKDFAGQQQQGTLAEKQLSLQEKLLAGQLSGAQATNEANRQAAAEYMELLRSEKKESRKDKNEARRMQLIMSLLAGFQNFGQQANQMQFQSDLPAPPTSLIGLLRG